MNEQLPFRPNVCLLIANRENKLFLGERNGSPGIWQLPQGGVETDSSEEESALREACEELGVEPELLRVIAKLTATHSYDFREPPAYAIGKWRGQRQTFWLLRFLGEDTDIDLARYEPEFSSFCWCTAEEVRGKAEPRRMAGYMQPLQEFEQIIKEL